MHKINCIFTHQKQILALLSGFPLFYSLSKIPECLRTERALEILPDLSVIIPARNEQETIGTLLKSIKEQPWQPKEILVVDDHSTDNTADIAQEAGATLLKPPELPEGWTGKNWACSYGAHHASGNFFLFIDADVSFEYWGLNRIAAEYYHNQGVLSILPFNKAETVFQQFLSVFNIVNLIGVAAISPQIKSPHGLFGQSLLCSRKDYFAVGGHESVKGSPIEHLKLSENFRHHSIPLHLFRGRGTLTTIPYPGGIGSLVKGWSRIAASGALSGNHFGVLISAAWISGALAPLFGFFGKKTHKSRISSLFLYSVYSCGMYKLLRKLGTYQVWTAILYHLHIIFFTTVFLLSLFQLTSGTYTWKGRKSTFYR